MWKNRQWKLFDKILAAIIVALIIFAGVIFWWPAKTAWQTNVNNSAENQKHNFVYFSALDGTGVLSKQEEIPTVVGVMIDNHSLARPQFGIDEARVVYEVPVEGSITRFFALFDSKQAVPKVGPVRSARPYFLDWLREYGDALYLHSGGSPDALEKIKETGIFDANEFWWGSYYYRDRNLDAPHNLFTSGENWQKIFDKFGSGRSAVGWEGWKFNTNNQDFSGTDISALQIKYSTNYAVEWKYDPVNRNFVRHLNAKQFFAAGDKPIVANTVLVQVVTEKILDAQGRLELGTIGNGEARVVRDGKLVRGTWRKENTSGRTRFFDEQGHEIVLAPGKIWVQVVSQSAEISITN